MACANPVSAAKLFMRLAPARPPAQSALPVLDFLLPRTSGRRAGPVAAAAINAPRPVFGSSPANQTRPVARPAARPSSSCFQNAHSTRTSPAAWPALSPRKSPQPSLSSATAFCYRTARPYTQAVYNPQKDEDGNEMKMEITPRAAKRLSEIMKKDSNPHLALRIQVESGGCHGFQYLMSLVTLPSALPPLPAAGAEPAEHPGEGADSGVVREDDTIFTYAKEGEGEGEGEVGLADPSSGPKIILDQPSLELLKGSKVDYTMELIGSQFKVVDNPMATSSCGCGTSFDLKSL